VKRRIQAEVRGAVQGVGFRPFIYRCAHDLHLTGWVENTSFGVRLEAEGEDEAVGALLRLIEKAPPPNATVQSVHVGELDCRGDADFVIRNSATDGARVAQILPDLATCDACLRELFDPADRRYLYPFINCTHCGPRYSIVEGVPYDRARTSMRHFPMCPACLAEYQDPLDRRFHAEPNACRECGPRIALWNTDGTTLVRDHEALLAAIEAIRDGRIVAVKGIGGFHLMVDARDDAAVTRLRARKCRPAKPLAVMFPSLADIAHDCDVTAGESELLTNPARPIVLVRRRSGLVAPSVAPGNPRLGAFLPYAPLHHILLRELDFPVVATSGNRSDEPIATDESEALARLDGIADLFLVHNRPIVRAIDDSILRVVAGRELMLRRARGYAPTPVPVVGVRAGVLALGGHMKTTVAITLDDSVLVSQHLGDLETATARAAHERATADMVQLRGMAPHAVVRDLHPDYATGRMAEAMGLPVHRVQHHLAHIAACMAENGVPPPVLGVAWDGTGYGTDATIWGGEFLLVTRDDWRRVAHLRPFRLPGGEQAVHEPRRAALGLLYDVFGAAGLEMDDLAPVADFARAERSVLRAMLDEGVNAPVTSSMGRLFDGFAALAGLRLRASYEGQAAAEFEWAAEKVHAPYEFTLRDGDPLILDWQPALEALLRDKKQGVAAGAISAAFHAGLAAAIVSVAKKIGERHVALTGGCFQNALLTELSISMLQAAGFTSVWHRHIPPNDGGLALGQAVWSAWPS
jgi:hydrogenase maturation protein HypF